MRGVESDEIASFPPLIDSLIERFQILNRTLVGGETLKTSAWIVKMCVFERFLFVILPCLSWLSRAKQILLCHGDA